MKWTQIAGDQKMRGGGDPRPRGNSNACLEKAKACGVGDQQLTKENAPCFRCVFKCSGRLNFKNSTLLASNIKVAMFS